MPKRTNDFQHLVTMIQRAFAPAGAKVTESAEVSVSGLSGLREIDVFIEAPVGIYTMRIAVEAKDHSRRLNVTDIETIHGKYDGAGKVVVDRVVVVAHRGFTKNAIQKARMIGIDTLTLREARTTDWTKKASPRLSN